MAKKALQLPPHSPLVTDSVYGSLTPEIVRNPKMLVACVGRELCRKDYRVERESFACYGLEFVAEGTGKLTLDHVQHDLVPGDMFLYGTKTPHCISTDMMRPMVKYFVNFFGDEAPEVLKEAQFAEGTLRHVFEIDVMRRLFDELLRESRKAQESRHAVASDYLRLIISKTCEFLIPEDESVYRSLESFMRCEEIMEKKFLTLHGLDDFSQEVGLVSSYICRLYKRFAQTTPHAALMRRKMGCAADLLISQPPPFVKQVALHVGYEDAFHFSRLFSRHFGCSPSAFAQRQGRAFVRD